MKSNMEKIKEFFDSKTWTPEHTQLEFCCGVYVIGDFSSLLGSAIELLERKHEDLHSEFMEYTKATRDSILAHALHLYIHRCAYHPLDHVNCVMATTAPQCDDIQLIAETALRKVGFKSVRKFTSKTSGNLIRVWILIKE